jgi:hypothetical protein
MLDYESIQEVKERIEPEILRSPGVTGVGIGFKKVSGENTDQLAIRVYVVQKRDVPASEAIPPTFDGIPTDVIEKTFQLTGGIDTNRYDPLQGGISIAPCRFNFAGTLGCLVFDNSSGQSMLLSCFHVLCVDNAWSKGDEIAQPSTGDGGLCPSDVVATLDRGLLTGQVDAAVAAQTSRGSICNIAEIGPIAGTNTASLNLPVRKRGRSTGLTSGVVDDLALTITPDYGDSIGPQTLSNQIGIISTEGVSFSEPGDSGAVVVNDKTEVVGLLFASDNNGGGVANPIGIVLTSLGVTICSG